jgi:XisI protein
VDKLNHYRELIKGHLSRIAELCRRRPREGVDVVSAFDDENSVYLLSKIGWDQDKRIRGNTLFVRLKDGKIWVEEDWTEEGIATELVKAGVPNGDIVLAFHAPQERSVA